MKNRRRTYSALKLNNFLATIISVGVIHFFIASFSLAQLVPNLGGQRSGISSMQFLKIGADARGVAMGEASVAVVNYVSAIYWNPAGLTNSSLNQAMFSHAEWLVDVQHEFAAASIHLDESNVIGLSFISLRTDPMKVTTEYQPTGTGAYFNYEDIAAGITFARKMTEQFSFGITGKYTRETIAGLYTDALLVDIGTFYYMGLGSSRFSVVVSNFGSNVKPKGSAVSGKGITVTSFQDFSPPTMFKLGFALEPWHEESNRITASIQLNHPNDNAENIRLGMEYGYDELFFARVGAKRTIGESLLGKATSTAEDFSLGFGVRLPLEITTANVDYSFTNFNDLGAVHRITVAVSY